MDNKYCYMLDMKADGSADLKPSKPKLELWSHGKNIHRQEGMTNIHKGQKLDNECCTKRDLNTRAH